MMELHIKNEPIDLLTLTSRLEEKKQLEQIGGANYLTELVSLVPSSANAEHYAQIVQKGQTLLLVRLISLDELPSHLQLIDQVL
jgi:replicative DNA helicase